MISSFSICRLTIVALVLLAIEPTANTLALIPLSSKILSTRSGLGVVRDIERPPTFLDERNNDDEDDRGVLFVNDESDDYEETSSQPGAKEKGAGRKRWESLNPKIKQRLIEKGQERAIANKKKREPASDKKRSECHTHSVLTTRWRGFDILSANTYIGLIPKTLQGC